MNPVVFNPIQTSGMPLRDKILNYCWKLVNKSLFRFTPPIFLIFRKYRVGLLRMFGADIDWNVSIHPTATIDYPWNLSMLNMSSLGERSWIYAMDKISIGEKSCIGKDVYLLTGSHNIECSTFDLVTKPINIGKCCWVATASTLLPGVSLGDFCVVGANSVVTKCFDNYSVVGGNPAKFIKKRIIND